MARAWLRRPGMSNQDAVEEAGRWLGTLGLGRDLTGQTINLTPFLPSLKAEGVFRSMVLRAVVKKLRKRGAREILGVAE